MSIFEENTTSNPLFLEDASGLDACYDQAVFMDDTDAYLAKKHNTGIYDYIDEGDYYE